jgi:hypothetical protein
MKNFTQWIAEAKKKSKKESLPPTITSAPLRGQNQDQTGFNTHNNTTDYTISDEYVNEIIAGVGNTRIKPVNMAQKTGGTKEPNAPSNTGSLQAATNQRVSQLDKAAQQQKDTATKDRETEIKKRQQEAAQRAKQSAGDAPKPPSQQK